MSAYRTATDGAEQVCFGDEDIFFSRTNAAGLIESGNDVFERVSGYGWSQLFRAPHKIVRHEDTPRAVFHALWRAIKAGRPIGAYVKNRSRAGAHYWVYAIVSPIEGGYLSVRIRPQGAHFEAARALYAETRQREIETALPPCESFQGLESKLVRMGFGDYPAFMGRALGQELLDRDARLGRACDGGIATLLDLQITAADNVRRMERIQASYVGSRHLPLSLQVQSARLGARAVAVGSIAGNYRAIVEELADCMAEFAAASLAVEQSVSAALFLFGAARVQSEMAARFRQELGDDTDPDKDRILDLTQLEGLAARYRSEARAGVRAVAPRVRRFEQACVDMRRLAAGLEMTRVVGKVESARLAGESAGVVGLLNELGVFQRSVSDGLQELGRESASITRGVERVIGALCD